MCAEEFHDLVDKYFETRELVYLKCITKLAKAERLLMRSRAIRKNTEQSVSRVHRYREAKARFQAQESS